MFSEVGQTFSSTVILRASNHVLTSTHTLNWDRPHATRRQKPHFVYSHVADSVTDKIVFQFWTSLGHFT